MKILFVYPNIFTPFAFSPAIQILSAVVKQAGHQSELLHLNNQFGVADDDDLIVGRVKAAAPDLIAFSATSFEYERSNEIAGMLKRRLENPPPIILGGVHATIKSSDFFASDFDAFCVGEGENLILEIAAAETIPSGLLCGSIIEDLDALPMRDWNLIDTEKVLQFKDGWLNLGISRGCPFNCTFCAAPLLRKINGRRRPRKMSVNGVINELIYLVKNFSVKVFNFDDDLFTTSKKWGLEFSAAYKSEIWDRFKIPYAIESRVDTVDDNLLKALKESGCIEIQFGIETGSPKLLEFVKKQVSLDQIHDAFNLCDGRGINTYAYIIVGIPGETGETMSQTFKLMADIKPRLIRPTFICPVYGTELYDYCETNDLFLKKVVTAWNYRYPLRIEGMSENELLKYWYLFPWFINAEMGLKGYRKAISSFDAADFREENDSVLFDEIFKADVLLSKSCDSKPHYHYHRENQAGEELNMRFNRYELVT